MEMSVGDPSGGGGVVGGGHPMAPPNPLLYAASPASVNVGYKGRRYLVVIPCALHNLL